MENVFVTGGAGYIGSHTCKALARAGYQPIVLDNLSTGHLWAVRWGPFKEGNIHDQLLVRSLIEKYKIKVMIHFAASAYVGESMHHPDKYFQNNVANTLRLVDAAHEAGLKKIVFSSTCATYGIPKRLPITEKHPQKPVNPYGESKLFVEKVLDWYGIPHGIESVCLRYFNAAGADPEGEIGEDHTPETHLIPLVIEAAMGLRDWVGIFGTDYATDDGTAVRDYIHVQDLADAHIRAVKYLLEGGTSQRLNLGTGHGYSVREVIQAVQKVSGRKVPFQELERRAGDPAVLVAQATAAQKRLGWTPKFTNLEDVVHTAWEWHRSHHGSRITTQAS